MGEGINEAAAEQTLRSKRHAIAKMNPWALLHQTHVGTLGDRRSSDSSDNCVLGIYAVHDSGTVVARETTPAAVENDGASLGEHYYLCNTNICQCRILLLLGHAWPRIKYELGLDLKMIYPGRYQGCLTRGAAPSPGRRYSSCSDLEQSEFQENQPPLSDHPPPLPPPTKCWASFG